MYVCSVAFDVYDVDGDGFISHLDLFHILKLLVGTNLSDLQLRKIVNKTISKADKDKDNKISRKEFAAMFTSSQVKALTVRIV